MIRSQIWKCRATKRAPGPLLWPPRRPFEPVSGDRSSHRARWDFLQAFSNLNNDPRKTSCSSKTVWDIELHNALRKKKYDRYNNTDITITIIQNETNLYYRCIRIKYPHNQNSESVSNWWRIYGVRDKMVHSIVILKIPKKDIFEISRTMWVFKIGWGVFNTNSTVIILP